MQHQTVLQQQDLTISDLLFKNSITDDALDEDHKQTGTSTITISL